MKANIFKTLLAVVALIIGATACDDKGYWEPFTPEGVQYSFITPKLTEEFPLNSPAAERTYTLTLRRSTSEGEATVNLKVGAAVNSNKYKPEDIFIAPESVTFADGEYATEVVVTFKGTTRNYDYSCILSFSDPVSPGGLNKVTLAGKLVNPRK